MALCADKVTSKLDSAPGKFTSLYSDLENDKQVRRPGSVLDWRPRASPLAQSGLLPDGQASVGAFKSCSTQCMLPNTVCNSWIGLGGYAGCHALQLHTCGWHGVCLFVCASGSRPMQDAKGQGEVSTSVWTYMGFHEKPFYSLGLT